MNILGIDEAGRGSLLGDLVMAGVLVDEKSLDSLEKLNIYDSKYYGSGVNACKKRALLAEQIKSICRFKIVKKNSTEIDKAVINTSLNHAERELAVSILADFDYDQAILDGKNIFKNLEADYPNLKAIDKADRDFKVVAAASILAKDFRDKLLINFFTSLPKSLNCCSGMGYPNKATYKFIKNYQSQFNSPPANLRLSYNWKGAESLLQAL